MLDSESSENFDVDENLGSTEAGKSVLFRCNDGEEIEVQNYFSIGKYCLPTTTMAAIFIKNP